MDDRTPQDVAAEDAAVARLRAADPGAGVGPDTVALRSAVDERRAAPDVPADVPDELAARRSRRWTGWPAKIAGVAAAALVIGGGGGYAIGAAGDSPTPAPGSAARRRATAASSAATSCGVLSSMVILLGARALTGNVSPNPGGLQSWAARPQGEGSASAPWSAQARRRCARARDRAASAPPRPMPRTSASWSPSRPSQACSS